ncbi:hypothetical protein M378DRAFT_6759 [Amanita muscaria Koide BX008]|uniref:rRNA biogenesis protein RRP36 n=1 Tax=Amanita muscaria (strain Koide BX008) TaxID=946122 RepID=A0A0C2TU91_AMAMK|nr:hypothetical protein M378DRAFT_6759 [Amanita muscaria Koide BX008]
MPCRSRPASRLPPRVVRDRHPAQEVRNQKYIKSGLENEGLKEILSDSASEDAPDSNSEGELESDELRKNGSEDTEDEDADADAHRVSQWVDEDELGLSSEDSGVEDVEEAGPAHIRKIQKDLSSLPFGAVRKAQRTLYQTQVDSDSDEESNAPSKGRLGGPKKDKEKVEWSLQPKSEIPKRHNKHAPMETSSKKPVTRRRQAVEVKTYQSRDPRFLPLTGEFSAEKFQNNYGFLIENRRNELNTLKENLKRARKSLLSAPRDQRISWENEVKRLELALKRTESLVNKDKQDKIQMEALQKAAREEREKQKQGKGGWWMKKAEKKKVVVEARYKALVEEGGKRAVKSAIEKKQKKIGQKEKRKRPVVRENNNEARKRRRTE